jgi:hypothetical protein
MFIEILRHTPLWVWLLLAVLLALGLAQTRAQTLAVPRLVILPLVMLTLGLSTLWPAAQKLPLVAGVWLVLLATAAAAAARWLVPRAARWHASSQRLQLPGSVWPLVLMMFTFLLKYAIGVFQGLQPMAASAPSFLVTVAAVSGLLSGLWLGRALGLLQLTRRAAPLAQGHTITPHASHARAVHR